MEAKEERYKGLKENLERFQLALEDERVQYLFKIAYKIGYDTALSQNTQSE